jgi:hypothetical protein
MRTVVLGKKVNNIYEVIPHTKEITDKDGNTKKVFTAKPEIKKTQEVSEWTELCSFDGEPYYNYSDATNWLCNGFYKELNISDNKAVVVKKEIFRADLNELHLQTNEIVEENNIDKEFTEEEYKLYIAQFNQQMIESNDVLKRYCDLHSMPYKDTDCIELFKLLFPNNEYQIEDGIILKKEPYSSLTYYANNMYNTIYAN